MEDHNLGWPVGNLTKKIEDIAAAWELKPRGEVVHDLAINVDFFSRFL